MGVQHIVKREAEAEAEPLHLNTPYNTYSHIAATVVNTVPQVHSAVNTVYNAPVVNALPKVSTSPVVNAVKPVVSYNAMPQVYNTAVNTVVAAPSVYNTAPHAVALTPQGYT